MDDDSNRDLVELRTVLKKRFLKTKNNTASGADSLSTGGIDESISNGRVKRKRPESSLDSTLPLEEILSQQHEPTVIPQKLPRIVQRDNRISWLLQGKEDAFHNEPAAKLSERADDGSLEGDSLPAPQAPPTECYEEVPVLPEVSDPTRLIKVLSWNTDGLNEEYMRTRARSIGATVLRLAPDAIYLQEVVPETEITFREFLAEQYEFVMPQSTKGKLIHYFTLILLKREAWLAVTSETHFFPGTVMGRHVVSCVAQNKLHPNLRVQFMSTHLESGGPYSVERKKQLEQCFFLMVARDPGTLAILGGDMNARDTETKTVMESFEGIVDPWEELGAKYSTKFTWDMKINDNLRMNSTPRLRFDRLYSTAEGKPLFFNLVGKWRLQETTQMKLFPSDHFGIFCAFYVDAQEEDVNSPVAVTPVETVDATDDVVFQEISDVDVNEDSFSSPQTIG